MRINNIGPVQYAEYSSEPNRGKRL
jgi:hypothetical protein